MGYNYSGLPWNGAYEFPHSANFDSSLRDVLEKIQRLQHTVDSFILWTQSVDSRNKALEDRVKRITENAVRECQNTLSWYRTYASKLSESYRKLTTEYQKQTEKLIHKSNKEQHRFNKLLINNLERWKAQEDAYLKVKLQGLNDKIDSAQIYCETMYKALQMWVSAEINALSVKTHGEYTSINEYVTSQISSLKNTDYNLNAEIGQVRNEITSSLKDIAEKFKEIQAEIDNLHWNLPDVYNPVTGGYTPLQTALNDMWDVFSHYGSLTARQYADYGFTCKQYSEFAVGRNPLIKGIPVWYYRAYSRFYFFHLFALTMYSPVTGNRESWKTIIQQLYNLINPKGITVTEYTDTDSAVSKYRDLEITTMQYSFDPEGTLNKLKS